MFKLKNDIYEDFFSFLKSKSGLNFSTLKLPLLENRLRKRMDQLNIKTLEQYFKYILENNSEYDFCLPLLTTHKTEWFREIVHFQWIQETLFKELSNFRIWSAACSSGEEVYSLLFLAIKNKIPAQKISILGSDISSKVLDKAISLPNDIAFEKQLHFLEKKIDRKISEDELDFYLRTSVSFKRHNLTDKYFKNDKLFDLIIVRNVFIYFDFETIDLVISNLLKALNKGGYLIIGLSENIDYRKFGLLNLGNGIFKYV